MALLQTDGLMDSQRETIIPCHYPVAGYKKKSCVSANMLKKILSVGRRNFFFFFFFPIFSPEKNRVGPVIYENTGTLLSVGGLLFYYAFLLIKNSRVGC